MKNRWKILLLLTVLAGWAAWNWRAYILLPWFEHKIRTEFDVAQIEPDSLAAMLNSGSGDILLLDTRSPREYGVSRLRGAERVDWMIEPDEFCRRYGDRVRGRKVILYCSIGYRSSVLLQEVRDCLRDHGALMSANLEGGLFGWYNQGRPVVGADGALTDSIHPYNSDWGHMVKQR